MTHLNRRSFIAAAAVAPLAGVAYASASNEDENLKLMKAFSKHSGLSLDDVADWFEGVPTPILAHIMQNARMAPAQKWTYSSTYSAALSVKSTEAWSQGSNPNQVFCARQLERKGDRDAIRRVLECYTSSGTGAGILGEFAF